MVTKNKFLDLKKKAFFQSRAFNFCTLLLSEEEPRETPWNWPVELGEGGKFTGGEHGVQLLLLLLPSPVPLLLVLLVGVEGGGGPWFWFHLCKNIFSLAGALPVHCHYGAQILAEPGPKTLRATWLAGAEWNGAAPKYWLFYKITCRCCGAGPFFTGSDSGSHKK